MVPACAGQARTATPASAACRAFLATSLRAQLEWKEEVAFAQFESHY
jgi:hypothetical protein